MIMVLNKFSEKWNVFPWNGLRWTMGNYLTGKWAVQGGNLKEINKNVI